ncbi:MAG: sporulation integral membrane protein YtvI [Clostridia bacterium]|nr:sporulation integral membrane protein YtvI [Clostridia bacterium]
MSPTVERRFGRIINILYFAIIIGVAFLLLKYCFGLISPFIFAFFVAMLVQRPTNACYKKIKKGKGVISTVLVLTLLLIFAAFISLAGAQLVATAKDFISFITQKINDFPTLIENVENWVLSAITILPDSIEAKLSVSIVSGLEKFKEVTATEAAGILMNSAANTEISLSSVLAPIGGGIWGIVKEIPSVLIAIVVAVVASCFMASDYDRLVGFLKNQLSEKRRVGLSRSKAILLSTLKQLIKAYGTIMLITFTEVFIGLNILKLVGIYDAGYIFIISAITCVVDIVPVLGTGTIMIPWALYSLITGNIPLAIGLIVIYVVILIIRQVIEPKLVAVRLGLPPVLTIAAMYLGTHIFGFIGIFLLPIILIMLKRLNDEGVIHLWKTGKNEENCPEK